MLVKAAGASIAFDWTTDGSTTSTTLDAVPEPDPVDTSVDGSKEAAIFAFFFFFFSEGSLPLEEEATARCCSLMSLDVEAEELDAVGVGFVLLGFAKMSSIDEDATAGVAVFPAVGVDELAVDFVFGAFAMLIRL